MLGDIIVWILLGLVVFWAGRRFRQVLAGDAESCGCCRGGCPQAGPGNPIDDAELEPGKMPGCVDAGGSRGKHEDMPLQPGRK